jgi:ComF family protein
MVDQWRRREYIDSMFRRLFDQLLARIPSQCAVCRAWPARPLCESCVTRFAQPQVRCQRCALPVPAGITQCGACLKAPPPLDACLAAVSYAYPWSGCISRFKFHGDTGWATSLATLLRSTPWVEPALEQAHWLLPMPLSRQRLLHRGFNQALLLARALAPQKTRPDLLLRIRDTTAQSELKREARLRNVQGAFAVEPALAASLRGRRIVLLDDVMTSGASLHAAAAALRQAGVAHITAIVVARTDAPQ